jgi:galactokinase
VPEAPVSAWAPGRVNLIGEHTDYSGGLVLPAATQFGITLEILERSDAVSLTSTLAGVAPPFQPDGGGLAASWTPSAGRLRG